MGYWMRRKGYIKRQQKIREAK